jgi:signal transduction histidine kinase
MENSIAGWVYQNKQPLILEDATKDPRFFRELDIVTSFPATHIIAIPLITKEKTIGVIEAANKDDGTFDNHDQRVLEALAAQAAIAIENTRLFRQSDMISELVHELRTPLSALSAAVHLLQRDELEALQRERIRQTIANEVHRLNELATNFLEFSRLESGRMRFDKEPIHLEGLLRETYEILRPQADQERITLEAEIQETLAPVMGDRNQLKRMLLNLITNAIKYNKAGGAVRTRLSRQDQGVQIQIQDTGVGIPEDQINKLFDRYYRVPVSEERFGGTGLGLTIARRIVQNHAGEISITSKLGEGSTFTVWLPSGV